MSAPSFRTLCRAGCALAAALALTGCGAVAGTDADTAVGDVADDADAAVAADTAAPSDAVDATKPDVTAADVADGQVAPDADAAEVADTAADAVADVPTEKDELAVDAVDAVDAGDAADGVDATAADVPDAAVDVPEPVDVGDTAPDAAQDAAADSAAPDAVEDAPDTADVPVVDVAPDVADVAEVAEDVAEDVAADVPDVQACTWFAPCTPSNSCHSGHWICPDTGAQCLDLNTNVADGSACDGGGTCVGGSCLACGGACDVNFNPCHVGVLTCTGNTAVCVDTGKNVADLTPCDGAFLCTSGACAPCVNYAPCMPANPCHTGYLTCGATPGCVDTQQAGNDGISCGSDQVCSAGSCANGPYALSIVDGGGQSAWVDDDVAKPVVLVLKDGAGKALAGATVSFTAPEGAIATPTSAVTDAAGKVAVNLRLNLQVSPAVQFVATGPGGAQITVAVAAKAPAEGVVFAAVNRDGVAAEAPAGVGTTATVDATRGLAVGNDGTVYFGEAGNGGFGNCFIRTLSPLGEVSTLAGTGACGFGGDGGQASAAKVSTPSDIALDPASGALYFADTGNNRVRKIDLASGVITTLAGGGTATDAPWGDEGPASNAVLAAPTRISFGPAPAPASGSALYISDNGHNALRWVDSGGTIHLLIGAQSGDCAKDDLVFVGCQVGCDVAFGNSGELFFTGAACGAGVGTPEAGLWADAIFRRDNTGAISRIAGKYQYDSQDDAPASSSFINADLIATDPGGNLFFAGDSATTIRRIDGRSGLATVIAGGIGQYGTSGSYVPGPQAKLIVPVGLALSPDLNLWFSDGHQVRVLWGVGHTQPSDVKLVDASTPAGPFALDAPFAQVRARVQLGAQVPVPGVPVQWSALSAGAGVREPVYVTDAQGQSTPEGRVGLAVGKYTLRAAANDIHQQPLPGSPVDLTIAATSVAEDTIFSAFAVDAVGALDGAATLAKTVATDVVASSDGHFYIAGSCGVFALGLPGGAKLIAGNGVDCTFSDGQGIAANARFSPEVLALDDAKHILYASALQANRVVAIDLQTGAFSIVAGGGTATTKPWGDGGPASDATLGHVNALALGNGGLYLADAGRNQIRFVAADGTISTLPIQQADCFWGTGCSAWQPGMCWPRDLVWDGANGQLLISAAACGPVAGDASAILAIKPTDTQVSWYAGATLGTGSSADGVAILGAEFGMYADGLALAYDNGGILHAFVDYSYDIRLRKIVDGKVYTVAGQQNPQPGNDKGEYGPLSQANFQVPSQFTFVPPGGLGKLAVVDNGVVRIVW